MAKAKKTKGKILLCEGITASRPHRECSLSASYEQDGHHCCKHHADLSKAKKKPRKRVRGADPTKAPTKSVQKEEQRLASFSAMTPAQKFDLVEGRGHTIERQRVKLARQDKELRMYRVDTARCLSDGMCIVCGEPSAMEALCSEGCAAVHGRAAADWRVE